MVFDVDLRSLLTKTTSKNVVWKMPFLSCDCIVSLNMHMKWYLFFGSSQTYFLPDDRPRQNKFLWRVKHLFSRTAEVQGLESPCNIADENVIIMVENILNCISLFEKTFSFLFNFFQTTRMFLSYCSAKVCIVVRRCSLLDLTLFRGFFLLIKIEFEFGSRFPQIGFRRFVRGGTHDNIV